MAQPPYEPYYLHHQQPLPMPESKDRNAINTLFVSGLPDDVMAREIHNLFRRRPGFDSCQLKYTGRGNQVVAFATFFNHQSAMAALHSLNGVKFDPHTGSVLHYRTCQIKLKKKTQTRLPSCSCHATGSGPYVVIDKRTRAEEGNDNAREASSDDGESESDESSDGENNDPGEKGELVTSKSGETAVDPDNGLAAVNQAEKTVEGGPCSTLFIANLGPNCTEDELKQVLSQYPGFNKLKLRARGGMPVVFADFEELEQAKKAMEELSGTMLPLSDRGGLHIEYARSKMRKT